MTMDSLRERLKGDRLSAVTFVMDYVQFDFNGQRLTAYVWPDVEIDNEFLSLGQPGTGTCCAPSLHTGSSLLRKRLTVDWSLSLT